MTEVRYWLANDGTQWSDEEECETYELELEFNTIKNSFCGLDGGGQELIPIHYVDAIEYVSVKTPEALNWWKNRLKQAGYIDDGLTEPGDYYYNSDNYEWELIQNQIDFYMRIKAKLNRAE